jgi:preprotein translocase subunit SecG
LKIDQILIWIQLGVSVLLAISILLQNRGAGLSASFGGDFGGYYTKRGMEKFLYAATIVFAVIFLGLSIVNIYLGSRSA